MCFVLCFVICLLLARCIFEDLGIIGGPRRDHLESQNTGLGGQQMDDLGTPKRAIQGPETEVLGSQDVSERGIESKPDKGLQHCRLSGPRRDPLRSQNAGFGDIIRDFCGGTTKAINRRQLHGFSTSCLPETDGFGPQHATFLICLSVDVLGTPFSRFGVAFGVPEGSMWTWFGESGSGLGGGQFRHADWSRPRPRQLVKTNPQVYLAPSLLTEI